MILNHSVDNNNEPQSYKNWKLRKMQCDESLGESHRDEKNPGDDNQPSSVLYTGPIDTKNTSFLMDHAQKNKI